jgi:protoporphyrinogen oxidase
MVEVLFLLSLQVASAVFLQLRKVETILSLFFEMRAVVLGGGVSGLAAALSLRRAAPKGLDIVLVDASAKALGGWLHSFRQRDLLFEHGGRGIRPVGPSGTAALQLIETIPGLPERTIVASPAAQTRYLLFGGEVRPIPTNPLDAVKSPLTSPMIFPILRLAASAGLSAAGLKTLSALLGPGASALPPYDDVSVHSYALRLFGDTDGGATAIASLVHRLSGQPFNSPALGSAGAHAAEVLLDAVMSGIYAGDVRQLSARSVLGSLWNLEREAGGLPSSLGVKIQQLIGKAIADGRKKGGKDDQQPSQEQPLSPFVKACASSSSVSFTGGMQTMVDAVADELIRCSAGGSGIITGNDAMDSATLFRLGGSGEGLTHIITGTTAEEFVRIKWQERRNKVRDCFNIKLRSFHSVTSLAFPLLADYVISSLPSNALGKLMRRSAESEDVTSYNTAARLLKGAQKLETIPFASVALVNLGYKGKNYLPGPAVVEERKKRQQLQQQTKQEDKEKNAEAPQFAGFGYLAPYCERKPATASVFSPSPFKGLAAAATSSLQSDNRASIQSRYSSSPAAGVLGMTWDSTVFPGQAASHAYAVESGKIAPRRDPTTGDILPGRDVDVSYEASEGETRVTVMMGGAMHEDLIEKGLLLDDNGSKIDESFAVYKALHAATNHVGLPAKPDEVSVAVARNAIPQYTVGHGQRVQDAMDAIASAYRPLVVGGSGIDIDATPLCLDVIGNSFHGVGIADSVREGLAAGQRAAEVLRKKMEGPATVVAA